MVAQEKQTLRFYKSFRELRSILLVLLLAFFQFAFPPTSASAQRLIDSELKPQLDATIERLKEKALVEENKALRIDLLSKIAGLHFAQRSFQQAESELTEILTKQNCTTEQQIAITKFIGDCKYKQRRFDEALRNYNNASEHSKQFKVDISLQADIAWSKAGTLYKLKKYKEAQEAYLAFAEILKDERLAGDHVASIWQHLNLSLVYRKTGNDLAAQAELASCIASLKEFLATNNESDKRRRKGLSSSERLWHFLYGVPHKSPLSRWQPEAAPVGAIVCVHGLGLDSRAYKAFGEKMATRGYVVYALDVRGFGAWQDNQGQESMDLQATLADLHTVCSSVRELNPKLPLFALGESMGGGIVIHFGADYSKDVDGIISSVPGAGRHNEAFRATIAAARFIRNPDAEYNVGDELIDSITTEENLRHELNSDPNGRKYISPAELVHFTRFMWENARFAKRMSKPVFVTQGARDPLVKEASTTRIFHAINSRDRNLLLLGSNEHLIFEKDQFSDLILDSICDWMLAHSELKN